MVDSRSERESALRRILNTVLAIAPKRALAARLRSQLNLACVERDLEYISKLCESEDSLILDLGCQTGYITAYLAEKQYTVVGLDVRCPNWQYEIWRKLSKSFPVSFVTGTGENLPFQGDRFSTIVAYATIEHVENIHSVLNEVNRILLKNGRFFIFGLPRSKSITEKMGDLMGLWHHERRFEEAEIISLLRKHGFAVDFAEPVDFLPVTLTVWNVAYLWLFLAYADRLIEKTPLKLLSHSLIVVSRKIA